MPDFTCNVCGRSNALPVGPFDRERSSCVSCGSNVRARGLIQALSLSLFGVNLALPDFPRIKSLRGIGMTDPNQYALTLAEKFDYRNTFFDREPRFDIMHPPEEWAGQYDFVISSEIFEHVTPPALGAFRHARRLLKESGVLVFTTPYSVESSTLEHYPELHEFGFAQVGERMVLVNRTRTGQIEVFENPVFHSSWKGGALEVREFSEGDLRKMLADAGF
jgi:SAM-dependent methyltransferase